MELFFNGCHSSSPPRGYAFSQINFQIPAGIPTGDAVPMQITNPDGTTSTGIVKITTAAPGIFSVLKNGQGQGAVLNQDSTQNFGMNPAARGSVVQIFATGAGDTTPTLLAGEAAPASGNPLILTKIQPTVTIGGQAAKVSFSGMAPGWVGLWQVNVEIPQTVAPGLAVPLTITAGGVTSNGDDCGAVVQVVAQTSRCLQSAV
jgi:uncharacterized protein (TIGR03437 family)